MKNKNIIY